MGTLYHTDARNLLQLLPEISAIIGQRDALKVENSRLRTLVEQVD